MKITVITERHVPMTNEIRTSIFFKPILVLVEIKENLMNICVTEDHLRYALSTFPGASSNKAISKENNQRNFYFLSQKT